SELSNKQSSQVEIDIKPAIDPVNDDYTTNINSFKQSQLLTSGESKWLLKQTGYLPPNMPDIPENNTEGSEPIVESN
ncbi:phage portal protein, partial [Weissella paramesenteroides]